MHISPKNILHCDLATINRDGNEKKSLEPPKPASQKRTEGAMKETLALDVSPFHDEHETRPNRKWKNSLSSRGSVIGMDPG